MLTAYALSIPLDSLSYPLSRALYATHNTILQVIASICGFVTLVVVGSTLAGPSGSWRSRRRAAGGVVKVALLTLFLVRRLRGRAPRRSRRGARRRASLPSRPGSSGSRRCTCRRDPGSGPPAASTAGSCGPSPPCSGTCRADPTGPRSRSSTGTTGRGCRRRDLRVVEDRRVGVGPVAGHHPGVGAAPGEEDRRRVGLAIAFAASAARRPGSRTRRPGSPSRRRPSRASAIAAGPHSPLWLSA